MVNSWPPYVFAEGVDIDFISKVKEQGLSGVEIEAATVRTYNTEYAAHLLGRVGPLRTGMHIRTWIWTGTARRTMRWTTLSARRGPSWLSSPT